MRHRWVVAYDISDPKRLRSVYHVMRGYGVHVQLSVFECDLSAAHRISLESDLLAVMNAREDQVLFYDLGPTEGLSEDRIQYLGRPHNPVRREPRVV
ncbi:MAG: CRISPR-associated endonuclease Cas2 [Acidobacteriota bacterium]